MKLNIESSKLCLSSLIIILLISLSSCSKINMEWNIIGEIPENEKLQLTFKDNEGRYTDKWIKIKKEKIISIHKYESIIALENNSSYCVNIAWNRKTECLSVFVYPQEFYEETPDSYIVPEVDGNFYYCMEGYDEGLRRNYLIVSHDNVIEKQNTILPKPDNVKERLNDFEEDFAFCIQTEDKYSILHNGYIVKDKNDNYLLLETNCPGMNPLLLY